MHKKYIGSALRDWRGLVLCHEPCIRPRTTTCGCLLKRQRVPMAQGLPTLCQSLRQGLRPDSATASKHDWFRYLRNIASLLAPGGRFVIAALRNCSFYRVGDLVLGGLARNNVDDYGLARINP